MNASTVSMPTDREVRVERIFNAPRALVWRAYTTPMQLAQWWGRGNPVDIERHELRRGGHWRFVEHAPAGDQGFEGRFREVTRQQRLSRTFEWDGMPGYVALMTSTFDDMGDGRTKVVVVALFFTKEERDGMLKNGMAEGLAQSYAALDKLLAKGE